MFPLNEAFMFPLYEVFMFPLYEAFMFPLYEACLEWEELLGRAGGRDRLAYMAGDWGGSLRGARGRVP